MPKLPPSKQIIAVLERHDFQFVSQRGSHAKYRKGKFTVIIPTPKKEIPIGTFQSIIRQSGLKRKDFDN